jgi:nucleoside-diphosphate-sugar epimerase
MNTQTTQYQPEVDSGTILVTGSSGFVGSVLLPLLQEHGKSIRTLTRPQHDLRIAASLLQPCQGVDTIIHLAACAHVNRLDEQTLYETNVTGTSNLLQAAITQGVRRLVFVSSILADPAFDRPRSAYGEAKWQAEQVLQQAHASGAIEVFIIRPVNVYGPGMKGNLMTLLRLISQGLMPPLPRLEQSFSLIGVFDLCTVLLLAAAAPSGNRAVAPVYPVTDGQRYTIKAVEQAMREALGKAQHNWATPAPLFYLGALVMEGAGRVMRTKNAPGLRSWYALTRNQCVDDTASRQELGYNPRVSLYSSLSGIVQAAGLKQHRRSR